MIVIIFICLFSSLNAYPQDSYSKIDSINNVIEIQSGRYRIESMITLTKVFSEISIEESIDAGEAAAREANVSGIKDLEAKAFDVLGRILTDVYELDLAQDYLIQSLDIYREINDSSRVVDVLRDLGYAQLMMGDMKASVKSYTTALPLAESIGDKAAFADIQNNLAVIYFQMGDSDNALNYFLKARRSYDFIKDTLSMAQCDNNIAVIYLDWKKSQEAMDLFHKIVPTLEKFHDSSTLTYVNRNLGILYENDFIDYDTALYYFNKSMEYALEIGDSVSIADNTMEIANVKFATDNVDEAFEGYQKALALSQRISYLNGQLAVFAHLGTAYSKLEQWPLSLENIEKCLTMEKENGFDIYYHTLKRYLIMDYAHLGMIDSVEREVDSLLTKSTATSTRNHDLFNSFYHSDYNKEELTWRIDSLNQIIEEKETLYHRYKMFFYCASAIIFCICAIVIIGIFRRRE